MCNDSYMAAFSEIVSRIEASLGRQLVDPVRMYVAGGAAVHFYVGARVTEDVDASFSHRIILPENLEVAYVDAGELRTLYFDRQYSNTFALMHEDFEVDAVPYAAHNQGDRNLLVYFLSPVDLAVSKLSRFSDQDIEDIKALVNAGLVTEVQLKERAEEAMGGYVGNADVLRSHLQHACRLIAGQGRPKPP